MLHPHKLLLLLCFSIPVFMQAQPKIDVQGHRGARGLYPENSIPAMLAALNLGVNTLELDVVISKDRLVVVSHEPWMNSEICLDANGREISSSKGKQLNLYELNYNEIANYDCGSKGNSKFLQQQKMPVPKPLLSELITAVERHCREYKLPPIRYNIEIKSQLATDGKYHPAYDTFAELVLQVLAKANVMNRTTIQSFDVRPLQYINGKDYPVQIALLTELQLQPEKAIQSLGFIPTIYSPNYKFVTPKLMDYARQVGMQVIPWTVNEPEDMQKMLDLGVSGIITDYPNVLVELLKTR
ncbi:MAG: glycerophosphodiester phosphodiesterase family protein [Sphingobacteriaceae bacterium]|nr:glycerophosphodiester phosphodiesterase family protein [Sphingobacteriaceae bacterium]